MQITEKDYEEVTKLQIRLSPSFILPEQRYIINHPTAQKHLTISICFAHECPGQWLSWAQLGLAGPLWPQVHPAVADKMASGAQLGPSGFPPHVSPPNRLAWACPHGHFRGAESKQKHTSLFPASAPAPLAYRRLMTQSELVILLRSKGRGNRSYPLTGRTANS